MRGGIRRLLGVLALAFALLPAAPAPAQPPGGGLFERFDRDGDGKLGRDEVPESLRARFDQIDADRDGSISRDEDAAFLRRRGRGGPGAVPDSVRVERDLPYAGTINPSQTLDLYLPRAPRGAGPRPVAVYVHGGAFRGGDKGMGVAAVLDLVAGGDYAAASINYRLSGEATWPAQIHDCKAAIRWVRAHAAEYGLDPDRIGAIGESAGGHLVAMLGTSGGVAAQEGDLGPHAGAGPAVRCVVDEFGPSDLLAMGGDHDAPDSPESALIGGTLQEHQDRARAASPITYVSKDDPPFLILHGTADPLVPFDQSARLARALKGAGVECRFVPVVDAGHGGFRSPEVARRIRQFLDRHLRDQPGGPVSEAPIPNDGPAAGR